ncbi:mRNA splicing factor 3b5 (nucleomorph) [Bigelowiella natans]|uniref:mRNA splicing factor 3b5 n=1 Tax=Bigelowiella natans TaxID=227086 RepID=Q3LWL8_BIGNA|nr:mRNA splicing factor 3b5 [Bigelowiella natans]ABA27148.1 mRNA splicing factor 3b5 [Bigelowiella natans]
MLVFSNQLDFLFWKYEGTGNRRTSEKEWISQIHRDNISFILENYGLLKALSLKYNVTVSTLKLFLLNSWFMY